MKIFNKKKKRTSNLLIGMEKDRFRLIASHLDEILKNCTSKGEETYLIGEYSYEKSILLKRPRLSLSIRVWNSKYVEDYAYIVYVNNKAVYADYQMTICELY